MDDFYNKWNLIKNELIDDLEYLINDSEENSDIYNIMLQMLKSPKTHIKNKTNTE